ncbi:MAG: dihydrolipoyl dehydrogenase family protein [Acidiferrobacterales bacterium]
MTEVFDIAVIGSGPGGYRAAVLGALRGKRVAIVEKQDWGGCCLNRGCVPKKDWYHSARLIASSRTFAGRGIGGSLAADLQQAWEHQETVVHTVQESYLDYMKRLGIGMYSGKASFVSLHELDIMSTTECVRLQAANVIIATGSKPTAPAGLAPSAGRILTTDMLFDEPPPPGRRVAVIGGGLIGAEFAFILSMLGLRVHWIMRRSPLKRTRFSARALTVLGEALRDCGIEPIEGTSVTGSEMRKGELALALDGRQGLAVDWALLGTGRAPFTDGLALDAIGIGLDDHGFVRVNESLQTSVPHVYAVGDCISEHMTANQAIADAAVAVQNIVAASSPHQAQRRRDVLWVPEVVYSAVELARIGMNEDLAEDAGLEPAVGFAAFEKSPCALGQDDTRGFVRLIGELDSGALLGAEVAGSEAGELIHMLALAPDQASALALLVRAWFNHPTRSEEFVNAAETLASKWGLAERIFGGLDRSHDRMDPEIDR